MGSATDTSPSGHDVPVAHRVLRRVAENEQCGPCELPPLADAVDPEILNRAVDEAGLTELRFSYHGYHVTVSEGGTVDVTVE